MRKPAILALLVFSVIFVQVIISGSPANAKHNLMHCCTPGMCDGTCWCCGQTIFCTCRAVPDEEDFGRHGHADEITLNINGRGEPRAFHIVMSNIDERLQVLLKKNHLSISAPQRLLSGVGTRLKLWCPGMDDGIHESKPSAVQVARDGH